MAPGARRTQAERSATTQLALLEATVACLVELGYARTSTAEVVRRAGVSHGALVHHYRTKDDLVLAALGHLLDARLTAYRAAFEQLRPGDRSVASGIDLLWTQCFGGSTPIAWLELVVAARTNPPLQERLREQERRFWEEALATFGSFYPDAAADPALAEVGLRLTFSILDGLLMGRLNGVPEPDLDAARQAFVALVTPFMPTSPGGTP